MEKRVTKERYLGIDVLKLLSMFMIVLLHVLGGGGVLYTATPGSSQYAAAWLLRVAAYGAANCFAIATGFLMVGRKIKYRKIVGLWVIVQFYNIVLLLAQWLLPNRSMDGIGIRYFLPVYSDEFWYFTAYFGLFLFMPFLNKLLESMSKKMFYALLLTGFLLFSLGYTALRTEPFKLDSGYSIWWLMYLYFLGAGMRKYGLFSKLSPVTAFVGYVIASLITFAVYFLGTAPFVDQMGFVGRIFVKWHQAFNSYLCPTVLAAAVFLVQFCLSLKIPKGVAAAAKKLQPLVFQVYVIHLHDFVWDQFLQGRFVSLAVKPWYLLTIYALAAAAVIYVGCLLVDYLRSLLFKLLHIDDGINRLADKLYARMESSKLKKRLITWLTEKVGI